MTYKAPFPWFGGKSKVAPLVWERFGDVPNYVEPFFGSGSILLSRPGFTPEKRWIETINDKDGFVSNFWRAIAAAPDEVTQWADWPVNENDLHARHSWLVARRDSLVARLEGDPDYYDAKIAGWWVWGLCLWIGSGWCSGAGPWQVVDGQLVHLGNAGMGVKRQLVHLGDAGMGVNRKRVHLGDAGMGESGVADWFTALSERLRRVRVCSGDWMRVMGETPTENNGLTGVFLDPPYSAESDRDETLYTVEDTAVAHDVRAWCMDNGANPLLRIVLCGYAGEHDDLQDAGWEQVEWKSKGGYGSQGNGRGRENSAREVVWFSPACLKVVKSQMPLFAQEAT